MKTALKPSKMARAMKPGGSSFLLTIEALDEIVDSIRRMEVLTDLLEAAFESPVGLSATTKVEAAHMIGGEITKLRKVLRLNPSSLNRR